MLYAAERMVELVADPEITSADVRAVPTQPPTEGVGTVEAPRGTLTHHYWTDERGIVDARSTSSSARPTTTPRSRCRSTAPPAASSTTAVVVDDGLLDRIEMAFRAYDPCFGCATHSLPGQMPLEVTIRGRCRGDTSMSSGATTERVPRRRSSSASATRSSATTASAGGSSMRSRPARRDDDARRAAGQVELDRLSVGGLSLMERLVGYDRVVLVDALLGSGRPGALSVRPLAEVACRLAGHLDSAHDVPLTEALSAGRALGARLPGRSRWSGSPYGTSTCSTSGCRRRWPRRSIARSRPSWLCSSDGPVGVG